MSGTFGERICWNRHATGVMWTFPSSEGDKEIKEDGATKRECYGKTLAGRAPGEGRDVLCLVNKCFSRKSIGVT